VSAPAEAPKPAVWDACNRYVRADGAILGTVKECRKTLALPSEPTTITTYEVTINVWNSTILYCPYWTKVDAARTELERVLRELRWIP
jgi:hypothetical protein